MFKTLNHRLLYYNFGLRVVYPAPIVASNLDKKATIDAQNVLGHKMILI